jgi:hypothetical protein
MSNSAHLGGATGDTQSYTIPDTTVTAGEIVDFIVTYTGDYTSDGANLHAAFSFAPTASGTE